MTITDKITLDLSGQSGYQTVTAVQLDKKSRFVACDFVSNGQQVTLPPGTTAKVAVEKPDKHQVFNIAQVSSDNKTATIELTEQMLAVAGMGRGEIKLYGSDGSLLSSATFLLDIKKAVLNDSQIESSYEFNALTEALSDVANADTVAGQAYDKSMEALANVANVQQQINSSLTAAQTAANNANAAAETATAAADRIETIAPYSKEQSDRRYAKAITCTASGTTATCTDVSIGSGLRKAEITADYTERDSSFSASKVAEKIIEVDNTAYLGMIDNCPCIVCKAETMQNPDVFGFRGAFKPNTQYTLTIKAKSIDGTAFNLQLFTHYTDGTQDINPCNLTGDMQTFTIQTTAAKSVLYMEFEAKAVKDIAIDTDVFNLTTADGSGLLPSPYNYMPLPPPDMPTKITILGSSGNVDYPLPEGIELNALPQVQDSYDAISGVLTRRVKKIVLTGTEAGHIFDKYFYLKIDSSPTKDRVTGLCSHGGYGLYQKGMFGVVDNGLSAVYNPDGDYPITDKGLADYKAWVAAQYTAGTPVTLLYELATPETVQYTPIDIPVSDSTITVAADTGGNIQVEYVEDSNLIKDYAASAKADSVAAAKSEDNAKKYSDIATASSTAAEQALANVQAVENRVTKMTYEEYEAAVKNPNNYYIVYTPEVTA